MTNWLTNIFKDAGHEADTLSADIKAAAERIGRLVGTDARDAALAAESVPAKILQLALNALETHMSVNFDFATALTLAKAGEKISRTAWVPSTESVSLTNGFLYQSVPAQTAGGAATSQPYTPTQADLLASDWHVAA